MVLFTTSKAWSWIGRAREALFHLNFYRIHLLYFILVIITSSGILYGSSTSSYSISYIDAIYLCTSAMCNVGLATINLNNLTGFQQSILFVLMFIGDLTVVTISVVIVRRYYISKKISVLLRESAAGRRIAEDIEKQYRAKKKRTEAPKYENGDRSSQQGLLSPVDHSKSHLKGYGSFPAPWDWGIFKNLRRLFKRGNMADFAAQHHYLSFQPKLDHKVAYCIPPIGMMLIARRVDSDRLNLSSKMSLEASSTAHSRFLPGCSGHTMHSGSLSSSWF